MATRQEDSEHRRGPTQLILLAVLAERPLHGYAIAREIESRSQDLLRLGEGSLYPALRALERDELIVGSWEVQPSGPARRVYAITDEGRKKLAHQVDAWKNMVAAVQNVIGGAPHGQPA